MLELHKYNKLHEYNKDVPHDCRFMGKELSQVVAKACFKKFTYPALFHSTPDFLCENAKFWVAHWEPNNDGCIHDLEILWQVSEKLTDIISGGWSKDEVFQVHVTIYCLPTSAQVF